MGLVVAYMSTRAQLGLNRTIRQGIKIQDHIRRMVGGELQVRPCHTESNGVLISVEYKTKRYKRTFPTAQVGRWGAARSRFRFHLLSCANISSNACPVVSRQAFARFSQTWLGRGGGGAGRGLGLLGRQEGQHVRPAPRPSALDGLFAFGG